MNKTRQSPAYTIEVFEDIGRAFCIALLDFYECNPISRLPLSGIDGVKTELIKSGISVGKQRGYEIE